MPLTNSSVEAGVTLTLATTATNHTSSRRQSLTGTTLLSVGSPVRSVVPVSETGAGTHSHGSGGGALSDSDILWMRDRGHPHHHHNQHRTAAAAAAAVLGGSEAPTFRHQEIRHAVGGVREVSIWVADAEDAVVNALKRLAQLAKDEQQEEYERRGNCRSIEDIFSKRLARLIGESEIAFDCAALHEKGGGGQRFAVEEGRQGES